MISRYGRRLFPLISPFRSNFKKHYSMIGNMTYQLSKSFSTGTAPTDEIKSIAGNKPPVLEESASGRYASVLFTVASRKEALHLVLHDVKELKELYNKSENFRSFVFNVSFKRKEQLTVFQSLFDGLEFHEVTKNFLEALIDNKRVSELPKVLDKYIDYYRILNKEENITILSAQELQENDKKKVVEALKKSQKGVNFTLKYKIDSTILGGLQMYSGNKFMDASLASRVGKIKSELSRLAV